MKKEPTIRTILSILFYILATILILQLLLKVTGHSPTYEQVVLTFIGAGIIMLLKQQHDFGRFKGKFEHSEKDFNYLRKKVNHMDKDIQDIKLQVQGINFEIKSLNCQIGEIKKQLQIINSKLS